MTSWDSCVLNGRASQAPTPTEAAEFERIVRDVAPNPIARAMFFIPAWMKANLVNMCLPHAMPLRIDLGFSNKTLKQRFEVHLRKLCREYETTSGVAARTHSPEISQWTTYGVLPCMVLIVARLVYSGQPKWSRIWFSCFRRIKETRQAVSHHALLTFDSNDGECRPFS